MKKYVVCFLLCIVVLKTSAQTYNIVDFGAVANRSTNNAAAIQRAIDKAAENGGTVVVPSGIFMTGTIMLKSNTTLQLNKGAVLKGIADKAAYPAITFDYPLRSSTASENSAHGLVVANSQKNVSITGEGTIDGNGGDAVFYYNEKMKNVMRPYGLFFFGCTNVTIKGIYMKSSAMWMQHYLNCDFLRIEDINVFNHANLNNDGVDIDDCHNIVVSGCMIDSDDDALCFKSEGDRGVKNAVVTNCILSSHASAFKLGTGSIGGFEAIAFSNSIIRPSLAKNLLHPFQLKGGIAGIDLASVDGAVLKNISVSGISIDGVETPFFIKLGNRMNRTPATPADKKGIVENIHISNISVKNAGAITSSITGYPGTYVSNISFNDIFIEHTGEVSAKDTSLQVPENSNQYPVNRMFGRKNLPASGFYVRHVKGVHFDNIGIKVLHEDRRPAIVLDDVQDAAVSSIDYITYSALPILLTAVDCNDISVICPLQKEKNIKLIRTHNVVINGKDFSE